MDVIVLTPILSVLACVGGAGGDGKPPDVGDPGARDSGSRGTTASEAHDTGDSGTTTSAPPDADGDGSAEADDCDDDDAEVYPGAYEWCEDGIDEDCDGADVACRYAWEGDFTVLYEDGTGGWGWDWAGHAGEIVVVTGTRALGFEPLLGARAWSEADWVLSSSGDVDWVTSGGDLDGDGAGDLAFSESGSAFERSYLPSSPLDTTKYIEDQSIMIDWPVEWSDQSLAEDLDGDGQSDLVLLGADYVAAVAYGPIDGDRVLTESEHTFDLRDHGVTDRLFSDLDGDGALDLVMGTGAYDLDGDHYTAGYVWWAYGPFEQGGTTHSWDDYLVSGPYGGGTATGDVDGDGEEDLVVGNVGENYPYTDGDPPGTGKIAFIPGSEAPSIASIDEVATKIVGPRGTFGSEVAVADIDDDGRDDVAVQGGYVFDGNDLPRAEVYVFLAPFSGTLGPTDAVAVIDGEGFGGKVALEDFDLDGTVDLSIDAPAESRWMAGEYGAIYFLWDIAALGR